MLRIIKEEEPPRLVRESVRMLPVFPARTSAARPAFDNAALRSATRSAMPLLVVVEATGNVTATELRPSTLRLKLPSLLRRPLVGMGAEAVKRVLLMLTTWSR